MKEKNLKVKPYEHHAKYYETDQMGVVHHSNYIRWMEEARIDLFDQLGFSYRRMEEMKIVSPVVSVACEYRSMVRFDDVVVIEVKISKYNGIVLEFEYAMKDKKDGTLRTTGRSSHCFINETGRPISIKKQFPEIHQLLSDYCQ